MLLFTVICVLCSLKFVVYFIIATRSKRWRLLKTIGKKRQILHVLLSDTCMCNKTKLNHVILVLSCFFAFFLQKLLLYHTFSFTI